MWVLRYKKQLLFKKTKNYKQCTKINPIYAYMYTWLNRDFFH